MFRNAASIAASGLPFTLDTSTPTVLRRKTDVPFAFRPGTYASRGNADRQAYFPDYLHFLPPRQGRQPDRCVPTSN